MSEDLPLYSTMPAMQDTEVGGVDNFRRDFAESARRREAGVFGRSPEAQQEETVDSEPLSTDQALGVLGENFALRERLEDAEYDAQDAREERLDALTYGGAEFDSREEYQALADELLAAGGGDRMAYVVTAWSEVDPAGAEDWARTREDGATLAHAAESRQLAHNVQAAVETEYAEVLNEFQGRRPETKVGGLLHELVAAELSAMPNKWESPAAFGQALERSYESATDAVNAAQRSANMSQFRQAFRHESLRAGGAMRPPADDHLAQMASRQIGPSSLAELGADIVTKIKGTRAERQAAVAARNEAIRVQFAQAARGSGFGEGAREQAARALEAREEERQGLRPPNRGN
jgi:hypothetical protein